MRHDSDSPPAPSAQGPHRWRVTIRAALLAIALLAIVLAMITPLVRGTKRERFVHGSMHASGGVSMQSPACTKCHASQPGAALALAAPSPARKPPDGMPAEDPHPGLQFAGKDNKDCRRCHVGTPNIRDKPREMQ
jgi:hypothetical protein